MYPGPDGYNFDHDYPRGQDTHIIDVVNRPRLTQASGPEFNVDHHDMYAGADGYKFDFDHSLDGDKLRVTP
jgi:hypothetical protein